MGVIATALKLLIDAGMTGDDLVRAVAQLEAAMPTPADPVAEKRRAYDRERKRVDAEAKRNSTGIPPEYAESAETGSLSRPPNEKISNPPTHTLPDMTTARAKADPFPRPEWADPQHWTDLKANRKAKRLPNTPTAHAKLLRDIAALVDDDWPPGRLLEAIVARGWAAAYDPRENRNGQPARISRLPQPTDGRGTRPDPCLDMLRLATAAERGDPAADFAAWPALPAIGTG